MSLRNQSKGVVGGEQGGVNALGPLPAPPTTHQPFAPHYGGSSSSAYVGAKKEKMQRTGEHPNTRQKDAGTQHAHLGTHVTVDGPLEVDMTEGNKSAGFRARPPHQRPLYRLSVRLIDTYKAINAVYYEKKARRQQEQAQLQQHQHANNHPQTSTSKANVGKSSSHMQVTASSVSSVSTSASASTAASGKGVYNNGWDDENYDYILEKDEVLIDRYVVKNRIGKGSFGQVVRGYDKVSQCEVAIKIIKSRRPFMLQAKTEIELLELLKNKDPKDEHNIVRLTDHFIHRGHQVLIFEMLSYNLYDLLRYTKFHGVSLTLLRKFAKQILKALSFLSQKDVDIIHCDLKPENILLRHPKRSGIKVIDFGSSCRSHKRMYSYIQSRFYRSPEVMMGLPYTVGIDMWSLGCVLVEMHTGEPLFGGVDQFDQMRRLVEVLGMPPGHMLDQAPATSRDQFFEPCIQSSSDFGRPPIWKLKDSGVSGSGSQSRLLSEIIGVSGGGPGGRRAGEVGHTHYHYCSFLDFVAKMLQYDPSMRITPAEALEHPFLLDGDTPSVPRPIDTSNNMKEDAVRSPRLVQPALDHATQT